VRRAPDVNDLGRHEEVFGGIAQPVGLDGDAAQASVLGEALRDQRRALRIEEPELRGGLADDFGADPASGREERVVGVDDLAVGERADDQAGGRGAERGGEAVGCGPERVPALFAPQGDPSVAGQGAQDADIARRVRLLRIALEIEDAARPAVADDRDGEGAEVRVAFADVVGVAHDIVDPLDLPGAPRTAGDPGRRWIRAAEILEGPAEGRRHVQLLTTCIGDDEGGDDRRHDADCRAQDPLQRLPLGRAGDEDTRRVGQRLGFAGLLGEVITHLPEAADRDRHDDDEQSSGRLALLDQGTGTGDAVQIQDDGHRDKLQRGNHKGRAGAEDPRCEADGNDREREGLRPGVAAEERERERIADDHQHRDDREHTFFQTLLGQDSDGQNGSVRQWPDLVGGRQGLP